MLPQALNIVLRLTEALLVVFHIHTNNILECNVMKIIGGGVRSGPNFAAALLRSARLGGNTAMLLRAVLSAQADRVSAALGTRSGVEMRAGRRAAERAGAQIVLGEGCPPVCYWENLSLCCGLLSFLSCSQSAAAERARAQIALGGFACLCDREIV